MVGIIEDNDPTKGIHKEQPSTKDFENSPIPSVRLFKVSNDYTISIPVGSKKECIVSSNLDQLFSG